MRNSELSVAARALGWAFVYPHGEVMGPHTILTRPAGRPTQLPHVAERHHGAT